MTEPSTTAFSAASPIPRAITPSKFAHRLKAVILRRSHLWLEARTVGDTTTGKHELADLAITSVHRQAGVHYLATPWRVLNWVQRALPRDKSRWTFLDLGCGKGRALLSAADQNYKAIIGVEFANELATAATGALKAHPHAQNAIVHHADAATISLPDGPLVVFMFNPFGPPVIDAVADAIASSHAASPRPLLVAYLNPEHADVFERHPCLARVALPRLVRTKFTTLSPYALDLYATKEAIPLLR